MTEDITEVDLFADKLFSPKQEELFDWYRMQRGRKQRGESFEHILSVVWGRRCGKSDGGAALFAEMVVDVLCDAADEIEAGTLPPWRGLGKPRTMQRKAKPHRLCFVCAPEGRDLVDISGHLLNIFSGEAEVFMHPDPRMQLIDNGSKMLLVHEQACVAIWFIPTKQAASMVGRGPAVVLMTESGFIPSTHWDRLMPSFWDHATWVVAEGTPTQDATHWFTRLAVSGLPDGHDEADRTIAPRDPRVHTSRANTIEHAYLPQARKAAAFEAKFRGERWAKLWVYASWEQPADVVFDEFRPDLSVVDFDPYPVPTITLPNGKTRVLPSPDRLDIDIDWHRGAAPGAAVCTYVWNTNPLDPDKRDRKTRDPRPLFLVVAEHQDDDPPEMQGGHRRLPYSRSGWWGVIRDMSQTWGARRLYGDPSAIDLIKAAKKAGLPVRPAENEDKSGRVQLLNAQCHVVESSGIPALLVARDCAKVAKCLATLQWKKDKHGQPTDKPSGYNDHLADCLCYTAGRYAKPLALIPTSLK